MSVAQSARACWARPLIGATAAWSKNAQRRVTGNSSRRRVQSIGILACRQQRSHAALQVQQELLPPETTAVAAQLAVLIHHAMARDHDGNPVLAVRSADRALRSGAADRTSQGLIRARFAVGY